MVQVLTQERLSVAKSDARGLQHWHELPPIAAAEVVRSEVLGFGSCLPAVWFCDGLLVPVVSWDLQALEERFASGKGPVLYRWCWPIGSSTSGRDSRMEPAVLRMEAFIALWPLRSARGALAAASAYGRAIAAVPTPPGPDGWDASSATTTGSRSPKSTAPVPEWSSRA